MCEENLVQEALGQICWLEVPVRDVARAKAFYIELFGWEFVTEPQKAVGDCVKSMHFFNKGKTLHGAFLEHDEEHHVINNNPDKPGALPVLPTLYVLDCEETLAKAMRLVIYPKSMPTIQNIIQNIRKVENTRGKHKACLAAKQSQVLLVTAI
ncbi:hypothetical protein FGADI_8682 [Fusarium gaditjirri]|uniref:Glyoxalase/Bleomycin resistance-like N-terminal domain-containing protein n=1 Tax=Fusarium gaditjirri TaxID=282569 RepID=A0A8H4WTY2_9HYPO|nr:hypothetical protein FGADI_8682 [Fusarium gaditjirri]